MHTQEIKSQYYAFADERDVGTMQGTANGDSGSAKALRSSLLELWVSLRRSTQRALDTAIAQARQRPLAAFGLACVAGVLLASVLLPRASSR